ncbi:hypothetical protein N7510_006168 [Penicillium lagena]|uniref:uncharacterized protein n=1 Tax=Penicillium lagena TaxID=94218 RepID=UPI002540C612|nr:uncharacterized protein N7510_006168 [Penicillium lagena]KAJ5612974.1 hypothetical protein N7510_006168 [Penicillium lagena]
MHAYISLALFAIAATAAPSAPHKQGAPFNSFPFNPANGVGSLEMDSPKTDPGNDIPYGFDKGSTGAQVASSALDLLPAQSTPASSVKNSSPDQNFELPMEEMPALPPMQDDAETPMSSAEIESPSIPEASMMPESSSMSMSKPEAKPTHKAEQKHEHEPMTSLKPEMKPTATHAAPTHEATVVETHSAQVPATHATHAVKTMVTHPAKAASIHHKHMTVASSSSDADSDDSSSAAPTPTPSAKPAPSSPLNSLLEGIPLLGPMLGSTLRRA